MGNGFFAKWKGDPRSLEKRIGEFGFPGRPGSIIQDLATKAARYTLTIFFDGADNDIESQRFFDTVQNESGAWLVDHPVYGPIELQPLSVREMSNPVDSGNVTEMQTEWVEPLNEETLKTSRQIWAENDQLQQDADEAAVMDFTLDDEEVE
jgi:prophage DNA circulation protein